VTDIDDLVNITRVTGTTGQYEDLVLAEWTNSAADASYGSNGIYMSTNPIYDVQNVYGIRSRLDMRGATGSVAVNQLHGMDALINLNETQDYTVTDNISVYGAAVHGGTSGDVIAAGATGGSVNMYYGMWGDTADQDLSVGTCGMYLGSQAATYMDYGTVIANSGTMINGLWLNNHASDSPASMAAGVKMTSASTKMVDGINMEDADFTGADIVLDEGETISNATDGVIAISSGDLTLTDDATGGNLGAKSEFIGLPRIKMIGVGTGTNPAGQTISLIDDDPTGEYAPIDASVVEANTTTLVKYGTNAYQTTWAADAADGDGFVDANGGAGAAYDDMESAGILVRSDTVWASADLELVLEDDGGTRTFSIPALTVTDVWTWLEVNIATGDLSAISDVSILLSAQGAAALGEFVAVWDLLYVWDADDEEDLGQEIVLDGILGVVDPADGTNLVELTNYIIHYEAGANTHLVWITNESAAYPMIMIAY